MPPRRRHDRVTPWTGEPGTAGTVAVVGAGKMGLPLAAQFAAHGWYGHRRRHRSGASSTRSTRAARTSARSRASPSSSRTAHAAGRLRATLDGAEAARERGRRRAHRAGHARRRVSSPDHRYMDAAVDSIAPGVHAGSLVIFETTLPVGDTRDRYAPRLEAASGPGSRLERRTSSSPSRPSGCTAAPRSATSRRTRSSSAGSAPASTARAAAFYDERPRRRGRGDVVGRGGRVREARRHDLPRREHRARQRVRRATPIAIGVDIPEVIAAANSQPYSHIHQPGHRRRRPLHPGLPALPARPGAGAGARRASRARSNDGQVDVAIAALERRSSAASTGSRSSCSA